MNKSLKIYPEYFEEVSEGNKRAELRKNDRDFKVGEFYDLKEWNPKRGRYTGRKVEIKITHILQGIEGLQEGWCIFSFEVQEKPCFKCLSIDYKTEYYRCVGTMENMHNDREEAKSAILAMSSIINEQKAKIADLEKRIEDDYWRSQNNGK